MNQDTFYFTRITVKCDKVTSIETLVKPESKLIGIYDMLGRPVYYIRKDEVLIYLYNDGHTEKRIVR